MDTDNLEQLRDSIERFSHDRQVDVLRLLAPDNEQYLTENQNGTFLDLSRLSAETLETLTNYVVYVEKQQKDLAEGESEKARLHVEYFQCHKEDKGEVPESVDEISSDRVASLFSK